VPFEDEFALGILSAKSPYLGFAFPQRSNDYDRYLTFEGVGEDEIDQWRIAMLGFLRALSYKYRRPLALKSPPHTCRIALLLSLFPGARFVHVYRNPFHVFQSTRRLHEVLHRWYALQDGDQARRDERIIGQYERMYESYFAQRDLIPAGQLYEVRFEELERDPIGQLRAVYAGLGLPRFDDCEAKVKAYLASTDGYRKNSFDSLPEPLRQQLARRWRRCFDEWRYDA
jgi:hypothetical protein